MTRDRERKEQESQAAYDEGMAAARGGRHIQCNPHPGGSTLRYCWDQGHRAYDPREAECKALEDQIDDINNIDDARYCIKQLFEMLKEGGTI